jgi:drug/metabolite transporter (DMT)-like permease
MKKAIISLHVSIFLAGFTAILGKLITLNEALLTWYRLLITIFTMWLIYWFSGKKTGVSSSDKWKIYGVGAFVTLHWIAFYASIKYANVSVALVTFSSVGFFTAIFEPLLLKRRFQWMEVLFGLISMAGIFIIFHFDTQYEAGILAGIAAAVLAAIFTILNKPLLRRNSPETVTRFELTGGFIFLSLILPGYLKIFPTHNFYPGWADIGWLLILAWFCTVLSFTLSLRALDKISAFTVNLSYNLEPVYGILLAFIIFRENEHLTGEFWLGLSLIAFSVILQTFMVYRTRGKTNAKIEASSGIN